jgi:hypothetical protein
LPIGRSEQRNEDSNEEHKQSQQNTEIQEAALSEARPAGAD